MTVRQKLAGSLKVARGVDGDSVLCDIDHAYAETQLEEPQHLDVLK
jgi:hypothetical protein